MATGQENNISGVLEVPRARSCSSVSNGTFIDRSALSRIISYSIPTKFRSRSNRGPGYNEHNWIYLEVRKCPTDGSFVRNMIYIPYNGSAFVAAITSRARRVTSEDPSTAIPENGSTGKFSTGTDV